MNDHVILSTKDIEEAVADFIYNRMNHHTSKISFNMDSQGKLSSAYVVVEKPPTRVWSDYKV